MADADDPTGHDLPGDGPSDAENPGGEPAVGVSRGAVQEARNNRRKRRRTAAIVAAVVVVLLAGVATVVALTGDDKKPAPTTTTSTSTTESTTTTVPEVLATTVMPLTGIGVNGDDPGTAVLLNRPALVAKVDNDPAAMPQIGLDRADVVIELRVEGISRYMAVFHSQPVNKVGPVRSARTSDPDLLGMFGKPLFAWSGGNANVVKVIRGIPFIQNESHDKFPAAYSRIRSKRAPHNLVVDAQKVFERADQPPAIPQPVFAYRSPDDPTPGLPVSGVSLRVGSSPASFAWNQETGSWLRWSNNRRHVTEDGEQLQARNVVVLATSYGRSAADRRSPEAESIGSGPAWVFSGGTVQPGTWSRGAADQGWTLTGAGNSVITLLPGNTWVEMVDRSDEPTMLDAGAADALRNSGR